MIEEQDKENNNLFDWQFPIVKNISPKSLSDSIKGMTSKECAETMKKMFENIENKTGYKVVVNNEHNSPINVLVPEEYKIKKYQIKLIDSKGCGSFLYFQADDDNKEKEAEKTANEDLKKKREWDKLRKNDFFHQPYKPFKTISVVEYDNEKKKPKRGGIKFKLCLSYDGWYHYL